MCNVFKEARALLGITQSDAAARVGWPQQTWSAYERGVRSPTLETLQRVVDDLGLRLRVRVVVDGVEPVEPAE